jgi:hypothetical protein
MVLVVGVLLACAMAAPVHAFKSFPIGDGTTEDKPQSKLWYHDGAWWGILPFPDPVSAIRGLYFYRMVDGAFVRQSFPDARVDASISARADILSDGDDLYVLIYKGVSSQFAKYTYDALSKVYSRVGNVVPATLSDGVETATIAKDSTDTLWIAYEAGISPYDIYVIWSADHTTWSAPIQLNTSTVKPDDIAAMVAFDTKIGVFWSDQISKKFRFRYHIDTDPVTSWSPVEELAPGTLSTDGADDHIHLTVTPTQDILAATKSTKSNRLFVRVRWQATGQWSAPTFVANGGTRPIVLYEQDNEEVYIFYTDLRGTLEDTQVYKKVKLVDLDPPGDLSTQPAITIMHYPPDAENPNGVILKDITSTKDVVNTDTSLAVVASGKPVSGKRAFYTSLVLHAETQAGGSTASTEVSTSAALTAMPDHLYLAAIVTTPPVTVSTVEGLGLTWTPVAVQCSGQNQTAVTVWSAQGAPTGDGIVTATLASAPTNAALAVSRYSGVDATAPLGTPVMHNINGGPCTGGVDTASYFFSPTSSMDGAVVYAVAATLDQEHTPGQDFTERVDIQQSYPGTLAGLAVQDKPVIAADQTTTVNGTFSAPVDWAVIAIELKPPHD